MASRARFARVSHFFAGECTERGSRVKPLRFAAMNALKNGEGYVNHSQDQGRGV